MTVYEISELTEKELRRLNRKDFLILMLRQAKEIERLRQTLEEAEKRAEEWKTKERLYEEALKNRNEPSAKKNRFLSTCSKWEKKRNGSQAMQSAGLASLWKRLTALARSVPGLRDRIRSK